MSLTKSLTTTVPFFTWLFDQPEFQAGRFHTTYLDDVLQARNGQPFSEPDASTHELAVVAAAVQAALAPRAVNGSHQAPSLPDPTITTGTRWKTRARNEGLR